MAALETLRSVAEGDSKVNLQPRQHGRAWKDPGVTYIVGLASYLHLVVGGDMESSRAVRVRAIRAGAVAAIVVTEA